MKIPAVAVLAVSVLAGSSSADTLRFCVTIPSTNALVMYEGTDSAAVVCGDSGRPTRDVEWLKIYRLPITGGSWACRDSFRVSGLEGTEYCDSLDAGPGGHFYAAVKDTVGNESCPGPDVLYYGPVTSVPVDAVKYGELRVRFFTASGALVRDPIARGIYFWSGVDETGRVVRRGKIAVLENTSARRAELRLLDALRREREKSR